MSEFLTRGQKLSIFNYVTKHGGRDLFKVKDNPITDYKYFMAGGFAISFSSRAVNTVVDRFQIIDTVSDRLFSSLIINQRSDFKTKLYNFVQTEDNNLESYLISPNLFDVNIMKTSLTDSEQFPKYFNDETERTLESIVKINRIHFKISNGIELKVHIQDPVYYEMMERIFAKNNIKYLIHDTESDRDDIIVVNTTSPCDRPNILVIGIVTEDSQYGKNDFDILVGMNDDVTLERLIVNRKRNILCVYDHCSKYSNEKLIDKFNKFDYVLRFDRKDLPHKSCYDIKSYNRTFDNWELDQDLSFMLKITSDFVANNDNVTLMDLNNSTCTIISTGSDTKDKQFNYQRNMNIKKQNILIPCDSFSEARIIMTLICDRLMINPNLGFIKLLTHLLSFIMYPIISVRNMFVRVRSKKNNL